MFRIVINQLKRLSVTGQLNYMPKRGTQTIEQSHEEEIITNPKTVNFIAKKKKRKEWEDLAPNRFLSHNNKCYPIQQPGEERRPAFVCHMKPVIRYTPKKFMYLTWLIRGMSIDEALKQLSFQGKKGATIMIETILEAQKLAVEVHNVEFKTNLWIAESYATKSLVIKGLRRHGKMRVGEIRYTFSHYFVRLEEGTPPNDYYKLGYKNPDQLLEHWKQQMRSRKASGSL